ncbi:hypothetical protein [Agromyces salentinus]|uniref:Uncharacterized protein n=1 Tax=Agromyces salentinus TaxID=269421 RepID=A0ABN2ML92_9MICO|nr:hypothetical protein [Agromyces salentinus]
MTDRSIRIDAETAKQVAELAHLMETTKKSVLADAVAGYAGARLPALAHGRTRYRDLPPRERLMLRRDELLRLFEAQGSTNVRVIDDLMPDPLAPASAPDVVGDRDAPAPDPLAPDQLPLSPLAPDPLPLSPLAHDPLPFSPLAHGPLALSPLAPDALAHDVAGDPDGSATAHAGQEDGPLTSWQPIVLLAETDLMLGGEAAPMLEEVARRVLGIPVEVISSTALALFNPERLERLVAASTPL